VIFVDIKAGMRRQVAGAGGGIRGADAFEDRGTQVPVAPYSTAPVVSSRRRTHFI
jgi:hypothetical protein